MNSRSLRNGLLAVASIAALVPVSSQAASPKLMDTCINTFVDQYVPKDRRVAEIVKVRSQRDIYDGFRTKFAVKVLAQDAITGEQVASATCIVKRNGALQAMYVDGVKVNVADGALLAAAPSASVRTK